MAEDTFESPVFEQGTPCWNPDCQHGFSPAAMPQYCPACRMPSPSRFLHVLLEGDVHPEGKIDATYLFLSLTEALGPQDPKLRWLIHKLAIAIFPAWARRQGLSIRRPTSGEARDFDRRLSAYLDQALSVRRWYLLRYHFLHSPEVEETPEITGWLVHGIS